MNERNQTPHRRLQRIVWWLAAISCAVTLSATAAPEADLWPRWARHDPASTAVINHAPWGAFLARYVTTHRDGINRVRYGDVTQEDRAQLKAYLDDLATVRIGNYNRDEQLAYWINLYNALTVQVVLERYPVESILDIKLSPGFFSFGPWDAKLVSVEGQELTLNDIEHRILRPIWRDPRVHYGVNCASLGCPNLRRAPYTAASADDMLTAGAREYVNHPRGARVEAGDLITSSIYEWFMEDFGGTDAGVIAHLRAHAAPNLAAALAGIETIADDAYDWALNDTASADAPRRQP